MAWTRLILANQRTALECAKSLGMTPEDVHTHIYHHVTVEDTTMDPNNPDYIRNKLLKFMQILELWFDDMTINGIPERSDMDMILKLIRAMQDSLKIVGELDGKLNKVDPKLQIINIQNDMRALTNVIMMDMCPDCQPKALAAIEGMKLTATPLRLK